MHQPKTIKKRSEDQTHKHIHTLKKITCLDLLSSFVDIILIIDPFVTFLALSSGKKKFLIS